MPMTPFDTWAFCHWEAELPWLHRTSGRPSPLDKLISPFLADAFQHLMAVRVSVVMICQIRLHVQREDSNQQARATFAYQRQEIELVCCA
jgi:hypothetical protein